MAYEEAVDTNTGNKRFILGTIKYFYCEGWVVMHQTRLHGKIVKSSSLEILKTHLYVVISLVN